MAATEVALSVQATVEAQAAQADSTAVALAAIQAAEAEAAASATAAAEASAIARATTSEIAAAMSATREARAGCGGYRDGHCEGASARCGRSGQRAAIPGSKIVPSDCAHASARRRPGFPALADQEGTLRAQSGSGQCKCTRKRTFIGWRVR